MSERIADGERVFADRWASRREYVVTGYSGTSYELMRRGIECYGLASAIESLNPNARRVPVEEQSNG